VNKRGGFGYFTTDDVRNMESMAVSAGIILRKSQVGSVTLASVNHYLPCDFFVPYLAR
jgi:hypothetical protein